MGPCNRRKGSRRSDIDIYTDCCEFTLRQTDSIASKCDKLYLVVRTEQDAWVWLLSHSNSYAKACSLSVVAAVLDICRYVIPKT